MIRFLMMCVIVCSSFQVFAGTRDENLKIVRAELHKVQQMIKAYKLDVQVKMALPMKPVAISKQGEQSAVLKNLFQSSTFRTVRCEDSDDDDTTIIIDHDDDDDMHCSPRCVDRWADGSCRQWGADSCGTGDDGGSCTPRCIDRWADGTCRQWGEDACN